MKIKSYEDAVRYLESFIGKIVFRVDEDILKHHDPLERMRALLSLLGNPQNQFKSVLIGGTAGKGSTAYLISHILTTAGYKTGLTLSPHLQKVNERIQINDKQISDEKFTRMVNSIVQTIKLMRRMEVGEPSYFEIIIAMAFKYFADEKVDIAVVEVGMGGEFDATNTLYPLIAVLTNVSLDHTNVLGGTVQKIARTKVGIVKGFSSCHSEFISGSPARRQVCLQSNEMLKHPPATQPARLPSKARRPGALRAGVQHDKKNPPIVVTAVRQPSVIKIVEDRCWQTGAKLLRLNKDFHFKIREEALEGSIFDLIIFSDRRKKLNGLTLSLLGKHQVENASLAVVAVLQLKKFGFKVSEGDVRRALKTAFFPGRFEVVNFEGSCHSLNEGTEAARKNFLVRNAKKGSYLNRFKNPASAHNENFVGSPRQGFPARGEPRPFYDHNYTLVLDGAHNPTKMKAFLSTLKKLYPKNPPTSSSFAKASEGLRGASKVFVIAFKNDKNIKGMLKQILQAADSIVITEFKAKTDLNVSASADAHSIKNQIIKIRYSGRVSVKKDSKKAIKEAFRLLPIEQSSNQTIVVITGSLYLVGEIRSML